MAVALNGSVLTATASVGTGTFNVTSVVVPSGSNQALIVWTSNTDIANTITGVSWNGQSLTAYQSFTAHSRWITLWYLLNPTPATANAVVTVTTGLNGLQFAAAFTLSGVNQSTPFGGFVTQNTTGTGNPIVSPSISGAVGDLFIDFNNDGNQAGSTAQTPGAGQTNNPAAFANGPVVCMGSYKAGSASTTLSWTLAQNPDGLWMVVDVQQAPVGLPVAIALAGQPGPGVGPFSNTQFSTFPFAISLPAPPAAPLQIGKIQLPGPGVGPLIRQQFQNPLFSQFGVPAAPSSGGLVVGQRNRYVTHRRGTPSF